MSDRDPHWLPAPYIANSGAYDAAGEDADLRNDRILGGTRAFNAPDTASETARMKVLLKMETEQEPREAPTPTKSVDLTNDELFCLLDGLRWMQISISQRPPQMRESMLSAMRKLNAVMGVRL